MAVRSQVEVFDEGGTLLCTNRCTTLFPTLGGYGGQPMPRGASPIPERDPDLVIDDHIGAAQNLLYRLTGDTNLVHVDRDVAVSPGAWTAPSSMTCAPTATSAAWPPPSSFPATRRS